MAAHRYWRIYCTSGWASSTSVTIGSVVMRSVSGGTNLSVTGSGTASASSVFDSGYTADKAFQNDTTGAIGLQWYASPITYPQWLMWDFGAGNDKAIIELMLFCPNTTYNGYVKDFSFQYSDDNSTWTNAMVGATVSNSPSTSTTFAVPEPITGSVASTIPSLTIAMTTGGNAVAMLPALTTAISSGVSVFAVLPGLTATVYGHDSTGEQALDFSLPSLSAAASGGASAKGTLPKLSASATGTVTGLASAPINLPSLSVASDVTVSAMARAELTLPSFGSTSYAGSLCSVTIGKITTQSTGTTGSIGRAQVTLPLFEATAAGTAENYGSAHITLPSLAMGATVRAALTLPSLSLTAIGTAVVAATYEAYAINLNHPPPRPGEPQIDEVTRYTNFPFTHIVRYQGSYYGANSTGLYLLEGTTDYAATPTAIPWAFRTATTDFQEPKQKTVAAAYFGGRLGPASTITLYAGEGAGVAYAHTTPRGATAQNYRQVFGKGVKARYYSLGAEGTGTMELDDIEFDIHTLTRRI